eukprot:10357112-Alexandrium_andersonii.AAC.1
MSASLVGSEMCIRDSTPRELEGPMLKSFLGPCSSSSECLKPMSDARAAEQTGTLCPRPPGCI